LQKLAGGGESCRHSAGFRMTTFEDTFVSTTHWETRNRPPRIHRQDLVIEAGPARLVFLHHPRLELALAIARRLALTQMFGHLSLHGPLD